jgi:glutathione peroxidase-family protein
MTMCLVHSGSRQGTAKGEESRNGKEPVGSKNYVTELNVKRRRKNQGEDLRPLYQILIMEKHKTVTHFRRLMEMIQTFHQAFMKD